MSLALNSAYKDTPGDKFFSAESSQHEIIHSVSKTAQGQYRNLLGDSVPLTAVF